MEPALRRLMSYVLWGAAAGLVVWLVAGGRSSEQGLASIVERPAKRVAGAPDWGGGQIKLADVPGVRRDHRPPRAPRVPATPPRLEIPKIGVRAHVIALGRTASGALDVPQNWSVVGWWQGGSRPGERGVSVLVGHVESQTRPAIFARLHELRRGDSVRFVPREGGVRRFRVVRKLRANKADFPTEKVYAETAEPTLRLITCDGPFDTRTGHYRDNLIVYAERI